MGHLNWPMRGGIRGGISTAGFSKNFALGDVTNKMINLEMGKWIDLGMGHCNGQMVAGLSVDDNAYYNAARGFYQYITCQGQHRLCRHVRFLVRAGILILTLMAPKPVLGVN